MTTLSIIVLLNGLLKTSIYLAGAAYTWYRRRGMLLVGLGLAGAISATRAIADAQNPTTTVGVVAFLGTPVAGLIVASFVAHQPFRGGRPRQWTP